MGTLICPSCGSNTVQTEMVPYEFMYGVGEAAVQLQATVPVRRCGTCRLEYLDYKGERAKDAAVNEYLKNNPREA